MLKVGDNVKVVMVDTRWGGYVKELDEFLGEIGIIVEIQPVDSGYFVKLDCSDGWNFNPDWLELIEEAKPEPPKLVIEAGKYYKTRGYLKALIVSTKGKKDTCSAIIGIIYGKDYEAAGTWGVGGNYLDTKEDSFDLIAPWVDEPIVDWDAMPAWANWVVMNKGLTRSRYWMWYEDEPMISEKTCSWINQSGRGLEVIPERYYPQFSGDWKDSKVKRPERKEKGSDV